MMRGCLAAAFGAGCGVSSLADAELCALVRLQLGLLRSRSVTACLLSDYTDRARELEGLCLPAVDEAIRRLGAPGGAARMPLLVEPLFCVPRHFRPRAVEAEVLFGSYVDWALAAPSLAGDEEMALVAIYGCLHLLRLSPGDPDREFTAGRERAQAILDGWLSSFDPREGWRGLPLAACLARVRWIEEFEVRRALRADRRRADMIFGHYLGDTAGYGDIDRCTAAAIRAADLGNAGEAYAAEDLEWMSGLLDSPDLLTRLTAAGSVVEALQSLYVEEAEAMAALPAAARQSYAAAVESGDPAAMTDSRLLEASSLASSVISALWPLEDECGLLVEGLKIAETGRSLCAELRRRGCDEMLRHPNFTTN